MINGHKWFISNARRADFGILICRTEDDPDVPQAANTAFIIDLPAEGWNDVREVETMHGSTGHMGARRYLKGSAWKSRLREQGLSQ